jgi:uncharacterized OsmC-like protein
VIVTARHVAGYRFELRARDEVVVSDQTRRYGGEGAGPMPSELFLLSVASCFGQAVAHVAAKMRVPLEALSLEVEGAKDEERFRFRTIAVSVEAGGCDAARLERIAALARKHCFVTNSISTDVELLFRTRARS